jgi:hypothetical protein
MAIIPLNSMHFGDHFDTMIFFSKFRFPTKKFFSDETYPNISVISKHSMKKYTFWVEIDKFLCYTVMDVHV